ncbi:hypothetical protein EGM51_17995 [Verrucomicrobia bacterium S94]|nr:hypothetical protein EGM51_17995 [Verrucomicrobia bacterium S94]
MKVAYIILLGAVAASAAGFRMLKPSPWGAFPPLDIIICEKPMAGFQSLKTPVIEKKRIYTPTEVHFSGRPKAVMHPLLSMPSLEERSDDMLFEADALSFLPFDEAVLSPFE